MGDQRQRTRSLGIIIRRESYIEHDVVKLQSLARSSMQKSDLEKCSKETHEDVVDLTKLDDPPINVTRGQFWAVFAILSVGMICNGLDSNLLGDAAPVIARHYRVSDNISWLSGASFLVVTSTLLAAGRLFDIFKPKYIYLVALVLYSTGEAISGSSVTFGMLLVGRAISGLGLAAVDVASFTIIALLTNSKERPIFMSLVMGMFGLMIKIGPLITGALLRKSESLWRWCFWLQLPIQGCLMLATVAIFPAIKLGKWEDSTAKFDYTGFFLQAASIVLLLLPLLISNIPRSALVACYTAFPFLVAAFFWHTKRLPESQRLIPMQSLSRDRGIICIAVVTFGANLIIFTSTFYYPQYFQLVRGATPLAAALYLLPCAISGTIACVLTGELSERIRYYTPLAISGSLLEIAGAFLLASVKVRTPISVVIGYTVIIGTGAGSVSALGFAVVMARVEKSRFGAGGSFINLMTFLGPAVGIAAGGAILDLRLRDFGDRDHLAQNTTGLSSTPRLPPELLQQFKAAYNGAQSQIALMFVAAGVLSLVASAITKHEAITPIYEAGRPHFHAHTKHEHEREIGEARQ